jgi:hypothetical protein
LRYGLALLLLCGCSQPHSWVVQRGKGTHADYASSKLIFPAKIPTDDIELEFLRTTQGVELFLIIRGRPITVDHDNPKAVPLKIQSGSNTSIFTIYRHDGGQKFSVPQEIQLLIIECLKKEQTITLTLPGYARTIDSQGFISSYDQFLRTPYLQNPFVLPF